MTRQAFTRQNMGLDCIQKATSTLQTHILPHLAKNTKRKRSTNINLKNRLICGAVIDVTAAVAKHDVMVHDTAAIGVATIHVLSCRFSWCACNANFHLNFSHAFDFKSNKLGCPKSRFRFF